MLDGPTFDLSNITKTDQQGIYSYRVETDGFEPIQEEFIIFIKGFLFSFSTRLETAGKTFCSARSGKPLVSIQESKQKRLLSNLREFECQVYSSSPILVSPTAFLRSIRALIDLCVENQLAIERSTH